MHTLESWRTTCKDWDDWEKSGPPYKIFGNTYYVGTCGISAVLVADPDGHILIDTGTRKGAEVVAAYRKGLVDLAAAKCDIMLTPHPGSSDMRGRIRGPDGLLDSGICRNYAESIEERLDARLAKEAKGNP
ncbi:MAG: hypothetical protein AAF941_03480 [Pseudomonadota bacterium]